MDNGFCVHIDNQGQLATCKEERPTFSLRWSKDGVLQQAYAVQTIEKGRMVSQEIEWRDVPTEK